MSKAVKGISRFYSLNGYQYDECIESAIFTNWAYLSLN